MAKVRTLDDILTSTSETLFPDELGRRRVTIDSRDCDGDSALHVVLWRKDESATRVLIEAGADPNAVGDMGETPLHVAVRQGLANAAEALLGADANPDIRSEFAVTPREMAATMDRTMAAVFERAIPYNPFRLKSRRAPA